MSAKFKLEDTVYWTTWHGEVAGVQHYCTACGQLHYAERYGPVVIRGRVTEVAWIERQTREGKTEGWRYDVDGDPADRNSSSVRGISEENAYATFELANEARKREQQANEKRAAKP